ncbi:MAG: UPF0175 family protein [Verrucomicrobium sp.]|nr:UPF0175 family protein [Verrucomicrobium sp.]
MTITIPDPVPASLGTTEEEVRKEVALALFAQGRISKGQARRMTGADWFTFEAWMKERGLFEEFTEEDLDHDLADLKKLGLL